MWVVLRLLTAVVVGIIRYFWRRTSVEGRSEANGVSWVYRHERTKSRITATRFGMAFRHPVYFRLSREGGADRFFKRVGFSHEIETGDKVFDEAIYVASDHPAVADLLRHQPAVRDAILALFDEHTVRIYSDGEHLWVHRRTSNLPGTDSLFYLQELRDALQQVPAEQLTAVRDPLFWRALLVESLVWGVALYGLPGFLEHVTREFPLYFNWDDVITSGLVAAIVIGLALLGLARVVLRGSSRSHRIFLESVVVLALGLPVSSVELVSDLNIGLDRKPAIVVQPPVTTRYTTVSHSRKGRRTHYHVVVDRGVDHGELISRDLQVPDWFYERATPGRALSIRIRPGALGLPWVEALELKP